MASVKSKNQSANTSAKRKKILLAYSGGLDTSVIVKWLSLKDFEVVCYVGNVGQREDYPALKKKAIASGASKCIVEDLCSRFVSEYIFPAMQFNARYESRYLLGTSLARPIIAEGMVRAAKAEKAEYIAHGATGKGNDQVRFELTAYALYPQVKIIAPWRDEEFRKAIPGRKEAIEYAALHGIPIKATAKKPWSSDENLLHISFEAGILEDPMTAPPEDMFELSVSPRKAPEKGVNLTIDFERGIPVKLNGVSMKPLQLMHALNKIGGQHGVGRVDIVESRFVGMKSRGVYETPGGNILLAAHQDLEALTLDRGVIHLKENLMPRFAQLVYNGFWHSPEMACLLTLLRKTQEYVTGSVRLELYKGNITITGRKSPMSLYNMDIASMEKDLGTYRQEDATGFINLHALPLRMQALRAERSRKK